MAEASQRNWVDFGMNRFAKAWSVLYGPTDAGLYMKVTLPFYTYILYSVIINHLLHCMLTLRQTWKEKLPLVDRSFCHSHVECKICHSHCGQNVYPYQNYSPLNILLYGWYPLMELVVPCNALSMWHWLKIHSSCWKQDRPKLCFVVCIWCSYLRILRFLTI